MSTLLFIAYLALGTSLASSTPVVADPLQYQLPATGSFLSCPTETCKRSIWDILWGSFTIIFACSWVAIHPHIPLDTKWWRRPLIRLELMMWTIICPEVIILLATKQYIAARQIKRFYTDRGWSMTHGFFIQMGGFMLYDRGIKQAVLSPERFADLLEKKRIAFPEITKEEIEDRGKGDGLSKSLVILQTSWFIIQVTARKLRGLAITQLEVATFAFATLNAAMYLLWLSKPLNVNLPIRIDLLPPPAPTNEGGQSDSTVPCSSEAVIGLQLAITSTANISHTPDHPKSSRIVKAWDARFRIISAHVNYTLREAQSVPIFFSSQIDLRYHIMAYAFSACLGIVFGAIHCGAWYFVFPSIAERRLWRVASVFIVAYPSGFLLNIVLSSIAFLIQTRDERRSGKPVDRTPEDTRVYIWFISFFAVTLPLYTAARVLILVESLLALRDLPSSATSIVEWTTFLPHI